MLASGSVRERLKQGKGLQRPPDPRPSASGNADGNPASDKFTLWLNEPFVAEPQAVPAARHATEGLAAVLQPAIERSVSLLVSELVANAVIHGSQRPTDPIAMRVWTSPSRIRVEVGDRSGGFHRFSLPPGQCGSGSLVNPDC